MDTSTRLFFALLFAGAVAALFGAIWSEWKRRRFLSRLPPELRKVEDGPKPYTRNEQEALQQYCRRVAAELPGCALTAPTQIQLLHRGIRGRCDFISDKTEIQMQTGDIIRQVVEVLPVGFPMSLLWPTGQDRFRARGSRAEYDRIFKNPTEERLLLEIGADYELRLAPDGLTLRIHSLPGSAAALGYWINSAFRLADLIPGVDLVGRVEVTGVSNQVEADSLCQVCGASLADGPLVRCAACNTPHHEECWHYARKCSTFGCASQRCLR